MYRNHCRWQEMLSKTVNLSRQQRMSILTLFSYRLKTVYGYGLGKRRVLFKQMPVFVQMFCTLHTHKHAGPFSPSQLFAFDNNFSTFASDLPASEKYRYMLISIMTVLTVMYAETKVQAMITNRLLPPVI